VVVLVNHRNPDTVARSSSVTDSRTPTPTSATPTATTPTATAPTATGAGATSQVSRDSAVSFVEQAIPQMFGYDYRSYDTHVRTATRLMTPSYTQSYRQVADGLKPAVVRGRATVTATVGASGLMGIDHGGAQVLAFLDVRSETAGHMNVSESTAILTLRPDGDSWLVDQVDTGTPTSVIDESDPGRGAAMAAAIREATALLEVDYRHLASTRSTVLAGSTGDLAAQYRATSEQMARTARTHHSVETADALGAGVVAYDPTSATVIVATTGTVSSDGAPPQSRSSRLRLTLVMLGGRWLVSGVTFVS
jgi:Mce-associated membrane protein